MTRDAVDLAMGGAGLPEVSVKVKDTVVAVVEPVGVGRGDRDDLGAVLGVGAAQWTGGAGKARAGGGDAQERFALFAVGRLARAWPVLRAS